MFYTFSFADSYYDADFQQFGALRAINEDRMTAQDKIRMHPHRAMEIFSYILSGQLTQYDFSTFLTTVVTILAQWRLYEKRRNDQSGKCSDDVRRNRYQAQRVQLG
ncbi:hypothetical protein FRC08_013400 [Ceratobasidium sp. 394]|nr:hypothetical protein FRC08_013400 [Ceratobasidium sp. 394]KAG9075834.1 hypothetical protein FS749_012460 [Ceratobasidium sp. UAMH 11750]